MTDRALVVGGTGLAGRAIAVALAESGWRVMAASRGNRPVPEVLQRAGVQVIQLDSSQAGALAEAVCKKGFELFVHAAAYTAHDASELLRAADGIGSAIVLSTMSVYTDHLGRSLDESTGADSDLILPVPIPETNPILLPSDATYSTRKVAMEKRLLDQDHLPVTILRPGAIHGPGDLQSREWHFAKRVLDGRPHVVVAHDGDSRFSVTSLANLSALVLHAADRPATRVLNAVDGVTPTVSEIAPAVAAAMGHSWEIFGVPGEPPAARTPWTIAHPFVGDMTLAVKTLDYRDVTTYPFAVTETCRWLTEEVASGDWRTVLIDVADGYSFDYSAEDELVGLSRHGA
jgi:nucleoside-diphosphate-sugar epimerase